MVISAVVLNASWKKLLDENFEAKVQLRKRWCKLFLNFTIISKWASLQRFDLVLL